MFCQIVLTEAEKDQLMFIEFVTFINSKGGKIPLNMLKKFFRNDSIWKCRMKKNGNYGIKIFCEKSNGELTWATGRKSKVIISTKSGLSACVSAAVTPKVSLWTYICLFFLKILFYFLTIDWFHCVSGCCGALLAKFRTSNKQFFNDTIQCP